MQQKTYVKAPAPSADARPLPRIGAPEPVAQPAIEAKPAQKPEPQSFWHRLLHGDPDSRRSKAERLHESSGYWRGFAHATVLILPVGLAAMFFAFLGAAPILADLQGRLAAIDAAKAEMVGK